MENEIVKVEEIESRIIQLRETSVMIDSDLALFFEVETGYLNERAKNNPKRFPDDFRFQLNKDEQILVMQTFPHLEKIKFSPALPYAYTYPGAFTLAFILRSEKAIQTGISITRAFENIRKKFAVTTNQPHEIQYISQLRNLYFELQAEHKLLVKQNDMLFKDNLDTKQKLMQHEDKFEMMSGMLAEIFEKIDYIEDAPIIKNQMGFKPTHLSDDTKA